MRIKLKDKRERKKLISLIEILLLISLSFTIPIFYSENVNNLSVNNFIYKITHFFNIIPSVSAQGFGGFGNIQQQIGGITEEVTTGQLGCCLVGTEAQFITKTRCDKLAVITGLPTNYNSGVTDELACIGLANSQDVGACVILSLDEYEKNSCKFTNKDDCNKLGGEFHKDLLCSNSELNTVCEKQKSVSCDDGKVGNGRDVVGSRHFRRLCVNGELKTEPCVDYRKEICVKEGGIGDVFQDMTGSLGISMPDLSSIPGLSGLGDLLGGF